MKLINIGFGNMVSANRLIAIVSPESAPIKRIRKSRYPSRLPPARPVRVRRMVKIIIFLPMSSLRKKSTGARCWNM